MSKPRQQKHLRYLETGWAVAEGQQEPKHFWTCGRPICWADLTPPLLERARRDPHVPLCKECDRLTRAMGTKEAEQILGREEG